MTAKKHPATGSEHATSTSSGRARQMATQNLPHDILSEIFLEVVSRYYILMQNLGTPAFARVCREWRALALNNPRLWTAINVPYGESWTCTVEEEIKTTSLDLADSPCMSAPAAT